MDNCQSGSLGERGDERENGGAERRQQRVCKSYCCDDVCASGWRTIEVSTASFSIGECVSNRCPS
eukprot:6190325-Pleurochrysis_carterae.AAC.1